jgi:hypothetical protein
MKVLAEFTRTTLVGGVLVILPIYVTVLLLAKAVNGLLALLTPVTSQLPAGVRSRQVAAIGGSVELAWRALVRDLPAILVVQTAGPFGVGRLLGPRRRRLRMRPDAARSDRRRRVRLATRVPGGA